MRQHHADTRRLAIFLGEYGNGNDPSDKTQGKLFCFVFEKSEVCGVPKEPQEQKRSTDVTTCSYRGILRMTANPSLRGDLVLMF